MRSIDELYELLKEAKLPTESEVKYIMQKAIDIFSNEKNVIYLSSSIIFNINENKISSESSFIKR